MLFGGEIGAKVLDWQSAHHESVRMVDGSIPFYTTKAVLICPAFHRTIDQSPNNLRSISLQII